jgi:hypothetical protein
MINKKTGEEQEMVLTLAERENLLSKGEWKQKLSTAKFISGHGNDILKKTHKNAGKHSKIQT